MKMIKICRPFITKNGVRVYAKDFGMKAFCWYVSEEENQQYWEKRRAKEKDKKDKLIQPEIDEDKEEVKKE